MGRVRNTQDKYQVEGLKVSTETRALSMEYSKDKYQIELALNIPKIDINEKV